MYKFIGLAALALLTGCASVPSGDSRANTADQLASNYNWDSEVLAAEKFDLQVYSHEGAGDELTIYIEGDGLAWMSKSVESRDPTPINPVGLRLAVKDKGKAAYIARPCQYTGGVTARNCSIAVWTTDRFSLDVVGSVNRVVNELKSDFKVTKLHLVGYSGGGAVAALVASQRDDVVRLTTYAGNLDHKRWTEYHRISPLTGSLNPADYRSRLEDLEQVHYAGSRDTNIPPAFAKSFISGFTNAKVIIEDRNHSWTK